MLSDEREAISAMRVWAENLKPFSDAQIETALKSALLRHPSWPPTLGEFMQLARGEGVVRHARRIFEPALPQQPMSEEAREAVKAMMAKAKSFLADARGQDDELNF